MAVNLIGNQLVKMYSVEDFNQRNKRLTWDTRTYCQIVREEQTTMFQVQVTEQTGDNILVNGDFSNFMVAWNVQQGTWIAPTGQAKGTVSSTFAIINQTVAVDANSYYLVEFNVDELAANSVTIFIEPTPLYGNNEAITVTTEGTHQIYFSSESSLQVAVRVFVTGLPGEYALIDYVKVVKYTNPTVTIEDCEGVTKRTLTPIQAQDIFNYSIDWFGLAEGCYRVCITGVDDLTYNYLDYALALGTEGGLPLIQYEGGFIKWYG